MSYPSPGTSDVTLIWIGRGALIIELLAVAMILGFIAVATVVWLRQLLLRQGDQLLEYERYRHQLARALLVGLEVLVAADVVRTVALESTLLALLELAILVLVRTFLSWSLVVELEGRWPWQPRRRPEMRSDASPSPSDGGIQR